MLKTVWGVIRNGKIELFEKIPLEEGAKFLVTLFHEDNKAQFWMQVSDFSLANVWENTEDDIYAKLLQE